MTDTSKINPVALGLGAVFGLVGVGMTLIVAYGIFRGGNVPMLLTLWPITGGLPLWGGYSYVRKGLGKTD